MTAMEEYIASLPPAIRADFERIRSIVHATVPEVEEGVSYAMPAYLYKGKGVLSAIMNKNFLSLYPFSGKTLEALRDRLGAYELTSGSLHFSVDNPVPEGLLKDLITTRLAEIDQKK